jgi:cyd operon protein YbgT
MWYFPWAPGVSFAVFFSIINAMSLAEREPVDPEIAGSAGKTGRAGRG